MLALRICAACVAAAMVCAALRIQRPELATAVSLGAGAAVLLALTGMVEETGAARWLGELADWDGASAVLRAAGIAVIAEMGAQVCADAGERALAGRIALAARVATLSLCLPLLSRIHDLLAMMLP